MMYRIKQLIALPVILLTFIALPIMIMGSAMADQRIQLTLGKADTLDIDAPIADILVANPTVVNAGPLSSNRLYLVGSEVGDTNILLFDEAGNIIDRITVHVKIDEVTLRHTLQEFFPDQDITARTVGDDIILSGQVDSPSVASRVSDIANRFLDSEADDNRIMNMMTVKGEQQVLLNVRIVEAQRSILRELGVNTEINESLGDLNTLSTTIGPSTALTGEPFSIGNLLYDSSALGPLNTVFRALEQDGLVNTLAEPNLTAISGETASFLAGGEFPVPVGREDGELTIEFRQFGVALGFTPTVLSNDRISLNLATEVSQLSNQGRLELNNASIPSLSVRRAESTVELGSGGRLMIAGLIESDATQSMTGLPGVSNIPILGELFKSRSFRRDESELVVMVTAYIAGPSKEPTVAKIVDEQGKDVVTPDQEPDLSATAKHISGGLMTKYGQKAADLIKPHFNGYMLDQ